MSDDPNDQRSSRLSCRRQWRRNVLLTILLSTFWCLSMGRHSFTFLGTNIHFNTNNNSLDHVCDGVQNTPIATMVVGGSKMLARQQ